MREKVESKVLASIKEMKSKMKLLSSTHTLKNFQYCFSCQIGKLNDQQRLRHLFICRTPGVIDGTADSRRRVFGWDLGAQAVWCALRIARLFCSNSFRRTIATFSIWQSLMTTSKRPPEQSTERLTDRFTV